MTPVQKKNLLLLDSNASRRNPLASRFRLQGYFVELSTSGFQSLSQIEKENFDTILIFGNLADMSALEIISLMRNVYDKDEVQIIFSDGVKNKEEISELFEIGVNEFLVQSDQLFSNLIAKIEGFKGKKTRRAKGVFDRA